MSGVVRFWRIAAETPTYSADDRRGAGAESSGGRWNAVGTPMVYASSSRALACLETIVQLSGATPLPLNRYLVEFRVPERLWEQRERFQPTKHPTWDALPVGLASLRWGTAWAQSMSSLLAEVPSVIAPEECNVLVNPRHVAATDIVATVVRKWTYDGRVNRSPAVVKRR